ncbi:hypothetical protein, partial [Corynebacterium glyciniphilum]|uniref:hypothetical protein n=1 Tax=Corynebacterium glyciniphilum TaxID=1404244 RepID=UPI0016432032
WRVMRVRGEMGSEMGEVGRGYEGGLEEMLVVWGEGMGGEEVVDVVGQEWGVVEGVEVGGVGRWRGGEEDGVEEGEEVRVVVGV